MTARKLPPTWSAGAVFTVAVWALTALVLGANLIRAAIS